MKIFIIPDRYGQQSYSDNWAEFLIEREVEVQFTNFCDPTLLEQISRTDGFMWRPSISPDDKQHAGRILFIAEQILKKPVFPDLNTFWHYDDKVSQTYLFNALNIPTPQTWIFWDKSEALQWANQASYPLVHKLAVGAGSSNVSLVRTIKDAEIQIEKDFHGRFSYGNSAYPNTNCNNRLKQYLQKTLSAAEYLFKGNYPPLPELFWQPQKNYTLFQEFVPENQYDTRVTIIGNRAFAFRRWNRDKDFRASGSGRLDYDMRAIDLRCVRLAFEISMRLKFQSMAYDFLLKERTPVLGEISYTFADKAVFDCPGYWDSDLVWHEGHTWPEEAQVIDFVDKIFKKTTTDAE